VFDELERTAEEVCSIYNYSLETAKEDHEYPQDRRRPGRDLNLAPPESRGSSVSIVTDYGLDDRVSIPDRGRGFFF
jgi:hypothetical protein